MRLLMIVGSNLLPIEIGDEQRRSLVVLSGRLVDIACCVSSDHDFLNFLQTAMTFGNR